MKSRFYRFIAVCGIAGYAPIAPGTFGSAVALPIDWALREFSPLWIHGLGIVAVTLLGVKAGSVVEKELRQKDPSMVVVDELAGMLITLFALPVSWMGVAVGFLLFRLFDIVKPYPCRKAEALPGGWGIMMDDVIAGVYANLVLRGASLIWPALLTS